MTFDDQIACVIQQTGHTPLLQRCDPASPEFDLRWRRTVQDLYRYLAHRPAQLAADRPAEPPDPATVQLREYLTRHPCSPCH